MCIMQVIVKIIFVRLMKFAFWKGRRKEGYDNLVYIFERHMVAITAVKLYVHVFSGGNLVPTNLFTGPIFRSSYCFL